MYKISILFLVLIFLGCGGSSEKENIQKDQNHPVETKTQSEPAVSLTSQKVEQTLSKIKNDAENIVPINESDAQNVITEPPLKPYREKSVTVYVHGYDKDGATYDSVYGYDAYDPMLDKLVKLTGFDTLKSYNPENFTNIITITPYYGSVAPDYYSDKDKEDIEKITQKYGGGIPRYALIVAKYAKHVMKISGADHVNFIGASLGALVVRWIIEKNVENLASEKKILRWQSIEGVVRGNKVASNENLVKFVNLIQKQPIDVKHMNYSWIGKHLHTPVGEASSPYYKDILVSQISSTRATEPFKWLMPKTPNDGYQALKDTYFKKVDENVRFDGLNFAHTIFHQSHLGIKKDLGAWAGVATFLLPHKRVKITLTGATVDNLHENIYFFNKSAEIVFASEVFSPKIYEKWQIKDAIDERVYDSGALEIHKYKKRGQHKNFEQVLFDGFVLKDEEVLNLKLSGFEIDQNDMYGVHDELNKREKLGSIVVEAKLENHTFDIAADEWSGSLRVEVFDVSR